MRLNRFLWDEAVSRLCNVAMVSERGVAAKRAETTARSPSCPFSAMDKMIWEQGTETNCSLFW